MRLFAKSRFEGILVGENVAKNLLSPTRKALTMPNQIEKVISEALALRREIHREKDPHDLL